VSKAWTTAATAGIWLTGIAVNLADPEEREGERFEVCEECLRLMDA